MEKVGLIDGLFSTRRVTTSIYLVEQVELICLCPVKIKETRENAMFVSSLSGDFRIYLQS